MEDRESEREIWGGGGGGGRERCSWMAGISCRLLVWACSFIMPR